jgi:hypothetical protein
MLQCALYFHKLRAAQLESTVLRLLRNKQQAAVH